MNRATFTSVLAVVAGVLVTPERAQACGLELQLRRKRCARFQRRL